MSVKRILDVAVAGSGLLAASVILAPAALLVIIEDGGSPFYIARRVGRGGRPFRMVKLRSMRRRPVAGGATSTAADDPRITRVGRWIRRLKLDELTQLWNVLIGDMSLVGPRPQVESGTALYTTVEKELLDVRPGITDLASIVFADEGDLLAGATDPDARYDELIRPWKSRLALVYVRSRRSLWLDVRLVVLTALNALNRGKALAGVELLVKELGGDHVLQSVAGRRADLPLTAPPGMPGADLHFATNKT